MVQTVQETLFVVARHPRLSVGEYRVYGHVPRFGEIDQPSADLGVVVNYQNTAAHNLITGKTH